MKIRSKLKDYYDSALGYGVDENLYYVRDQRIFDTDEITNKNPVITSSVLHSLHGRDFAYKYNTYEYRRDSERAIIGFCGKLYLFQHSIVYGDYLNRTKDVHEYTYDLDQIKADLDKHSRFRYSFNRSKRHDFFEALDKRYDELFVEVNAPVFVVESGEEKDRRECHVKGNVLRTNPILKDYGFFKVKDAYTAFQEISMYLSNQLVKSEKMPDFDDKLKVHQHGFTEKSFRHPVRLKDL